MAGTADAAVPGARVTTLPAADEPSPPVNRMLPLADQPYVRRTPPLEPTATCRLCHAKASVIPHEKTMVPHRIRLDPKEPLCPDRGLYASDVAWWEAERLAAGLDPW